MLPAARAPGKEAHPKVKDCAGKVAVLRGPIVYCVESPVGKDGGRAWKDGIFLAEGARFTPRFAKNLLGGVVVLEGPCLTHQGRAAYVKDVASKAPLPEAGDWTGRLYRPFVPRDLPPPETGTQPLTLIPYYAWANRGPASMEVWIPLAR